MSGLPCGTCGEAAASADYLTCGKCVEEHDTQQAETIKVLQAQVASLTADNAAALKVADDVLRFWPHPTLLSHPLPEPVVVALDKIHARLVAMHQRGAGATLLEQHRKEVVKARNEGLRRAAKTVTQAAELSEAANGVDENSRWVRDIAAEVLAHEETEQD